MLKSNHHPDVDCHHVNPHNNIHKNIFHKGPISLPRCHGERGPTFYEWVKGQMLELATSNHWQLAIL